MLFMDIPSVIIFFKLECAISPCGQHVLAFDPPDTVTGDVRCHYNWQSPSSDLSAGATTWLE